MAPPKGRQASQPMATTSAKRTSMIIDLTGDCDPSPSSQDVFPTQKPTTPISPDPIPSFVDPTRKFPFMKLAPETRNTIYKLTFTTPEYIGKSSLTLQDFRKEAAPVRNLPFATTCRQIYEESSSIFFGYNAFSFEDPDFMLRFLQAIGIKNRERLRKLAYIHNYGFKWVENCDGDLVKTRKRWSPNAFPALRYLRSCIHLETLDIYLLIVCNDNFTEVVRLQQAKELVSSASTIVRWSEPRMLVTYKNLKDVSGSLGVMNPPPLEVAPVELEQIGVVKERYGSLYRRFSAEGTDAFQELTHENEARLAGQEMLTQIMRQVKIDAETPQPTSPGSRRIVRKLPNVFSDSKHKTEPYGTNFRTSKEKDAAKVLLQFMRQNALEMPPMDVEYGDMVELLEEEVVDVVSDIKPVKESRYVYYSGTESESESESGKSDQGDDFDPDGFELDGEDTDPDVMRLRDAGFKFKYAPAKEASTGPTSRSPRKTTPQGTTSNRGTATISNMTSTSNKKVTRASIKAAVSNNSSPSAQTSRASRATRSSVVYILSDDEDDEDDEPEFEPKQTKQKAKPSTTTTAKITALKTRTSTKKAVKSSKKASKSSKKKAANKNRSTATSAFHAWAVTKAGAAKTPAKEYESDSEDEELVPKAKSTKPTSRTTRITRNIEKVSLLSDEDAPVVTRAAAKNKNGGASTTRFRTRGVAKAAAEVDYDEGSGFSGWDDDESAFEPEDVDVDMDEE